MVSSTFITGKLLQALLLVVGVTLASFLLMVYYGPDQTYVLIGKNATPAQIEEVRRQLAISPEDLAREFGVSYATFNRWENGQAKRPPAAQGVDSTTGESKYLGG